MIVGLTGGIGSGKSAVSAQLKALGISVVDADQVARDVVLVGSPALSHIAKHFGSQILLKDGRIIALVPNFESRAFKILGINTPTINPRSHLQYYTYNSFEKLADNAGFEIDAYFQELPVIDLMYDFISYSEELLESILKDNESYRSVYILKHKTS